MTIPLLTWPLSPGKSQLRHTSYCRKAKSRVTTRKKACGACTRAKTRCDMSNPSCSRCIAKSLTCVYEMPPLSSEASLPGTGASFQQPVSNMGNSSAGPIFPNQATPTDMGSEATSDPFDQMMIEPPQPFAVKWFDKNFTLNRSFVLTTLKSYPFMMLPDQVPPPFIHQHFAFQESDNLSKGRKVRQPPLQNCVAIVRWYSVRDEDNTVFVGNTIRVEIERLLKEVGIPSLLRDICSANKKNSMSTTATQTL